MNRYSSGGIAPAKPSLKTVARTGAKKHAQRLLDKPPSVLAKYDPYEKQGTMASKLFHVIQQSKLNTAPREKSIVQSFSGSAPLKLSFAAPKSTQQVKVIKLELENNGGYYEQA